ncbi:cadherin-like beta sandwich domain-containing protein [Curvibacter lanceolatus]|uniref:cadherin-like beta sandwich domain-containing protein n=1 Tax=Curvibacter lanceolatus TaxID=86182 RepID=UPI00146B7229|nr:cadherin-like beta sandwich domain-containing protein [Curvibacter lanceolatus]
MPHHSSGSHPLGRRHAFALVGTLGALALSSCGGGSSSTAATSSVATLAGLSLSAGSLSPAFASGTTVYAASVGNAVGSLTVSPTATDSGATIQVNGSTVASGSASAAISLSVGTNTVTVVVTASDGSTTKTYTVVVTRAAATLSSDATLSALTLSAGSLSPAFAATTTSYTATVANSVSSLTVSATLAGSGSLKINGSTVSSGAASGSIALSVGSNTVTVVVTAADGVSTQTYTLTVTRSAAGSCTLTATETDGPYPLYAILTNSAIVRSDIRESKTGVPLTLTLTVLSTGSNCAAISGAGIYIWHCDKDGLYSGYSTSNNAGQSGLTYLRGIQVTDSNGQVTFTTIYPGWYAGRITHIHVQVYLNDNLAVSATATTQLAFPQTITTAVYNSALYTKGQNTSVTSFSADNVFSDGTSTEMLTLSGDLSTGYSANMTISIA